MEKERTDMSVYIESLVKKRTRKKEILVEWRKVRKTDDDSLYTHIDDILKLYGILRAAYHGGDLTGVCVKSLMTNAQEIMSSIATLLIEHRSEECTMTPSEISALCGNCSRLLTLWDGVLHCLHVINPKESDYNEAQKFIDKALELTRTMGMRVIPKYHGTEAHLVKQMREVEGGLFEFDESWTEQYHQVGYQFDTKNRNKGSEERRANVLAAENRRVHLPETQAELKKLDGRKRGKRKATKLKEEELKKEKKERREWALKD